MPLIIYMPLCNKSRIKDPYWQREVGSGRQWNVIISISDCLNFEQAQWGKNCWIKCKHKPFLRGDLWHGRYQSWVMALWSILEHSNVSDLCHKATVYLAQHGTGSPEVSVVKFSLVCCQKGLHEGTIINYPRGLWKSCL